MPSSSTRGRRWSCRGGRELNYDPMRRARRGSSQISRMTATPLGCIKLIGTIVLTMVIVFVVIMLFFGHITHV